MARICEVCGRVDETIQDEHKYDILDVCTDCTEHVVHTVADTEKE